MHKIALSVILLWATAGATVVRADEMSTRTETRPQAGANYTVEKGVRVWRMQPAHPHVAAAHGDDKGTAGFTRFRPGPFHPPVEPAYSAYSYYPSYVYPQVAPFAYTGVRSGFSYLPQFGGGYGYGHYGRFHGHGGYRFGVVGVPHHVAPHHGGHHFGGVHAGGPGMKGHAMHGHGAGHLSGPVIVRSFGGKVQHGHGGGGPAKSGGMSGGMSGGPAKH